MPVDSRRVWLQECQMIGANVDFDDGQLGQHIKDSLVTSLDLKDYAKWNWHLMAELFKSERIVSRKRLENAIFSKFYRKLLTFMAPSSQTFHLLPHEPETEVFFAVSQRLVSLLSQSDDGLKFLASHSLLNEISQTLADLSPDTSCISPAFVASRLVGSYFDFIGTLCATPGGQQLLSDARIFSRLFTIIELNDRDDLLQILLKKLPWNVDGHPRVILTAILTTANVQMRRYATDHLRILMLGDSEIRCV
jgi:large subunit ribosomal protein L17e